MTILFYTTGLCQGRERLMPWRTVIEVAIGVQRTGHEAYIINGIGRHEQFTGYEYDGVSIQGIGKDMDELAHVARTLRADALFVECKWRDGIKGFGTLQRLTCKKYAYFTGGVYDFQSACLLTRIGGLAVARAYWMETVVSKKLIGFRLRQAGFDGAIGLTPYTTQRICNSGVPDAVTILPGKDDFELLSPDETIIDKYKLTRKRFICFTGAPNPTRGTQLLLKSIDKSKTNELKAVFLMRKDVASDFISFDETYNRMVHKERVVLVRERLTRNQLKAFFENAWYVVLPFIVIPSEIPLTFFEVMSCGTPILTFDNGGTSRYLKDGLLIAKKSVSGMVDGLEKAWQDDSLRNEKSAMAKRLMDEHPTWGKVTEKWLNLINNQRQ